MTVAEIAHKYNVTNQAVRYQMKTKNLTLEEVAEYYENKSYITDDDESNNELKVSKLEAQISKLKIESSEKYLKIQKAIKNLIDKKEVESFIVRTAASVRNAKALVFNDLPSQLEGLEAGEIEIKLQHASNRIDCEISKSFEKLIEELEEIETK